MFWQKTVVMSMTEALIVRCSHCHKLFSSSEFDGHTCDLPLNGIKQIPVVHFRNDSYGNKKVMSGWGID